MPSAIDATKPTHLEPTTDSVRANFLAAKNEIEALQVLTANNGDLVSTWAAKPAANSVPAGTRLRATDITPGKYVYFYSDGTRWKLLSGVLSLRCTTFYQATSNLIWQVVGKIVVPAGIMNAEGMRISSGASIRKSGVASSITMKSMLSTVGDSLNGAQAVASQSLSGATRQAVYTTNNLVRASANTFDTYTVNSVGSGNAYTATTVPFNFNTDAFEVVFAVVSVNETGDLMDLNAASITIYDET